MVAIAPVAITANTTRHFSVGPWIIVAILILGGIAAVPASIAPGRPQASRTRP